MIDALLRLVIPWTTTTPFLPHEQGVYRTTLTKPAEGFDDYYSQWTDEGTINTTRLVVGSVVVDFQSYARKDNLADCEADEASWFWDQGPQTLYIHYIFDKTPETTTLTIGRLGGFSRKDVHYVNDIEYEPRIEEMGKVERKVDPFNVGLMAFSARGIKLINGDAGLDSFITEPVPGALATIVFYDTETLEEFEFFTGRVSKDGSTLENLSFTLNDVRRSENITIPRNRITSTDWPDAASDELGKLIPEGYGPVKGARCIPLNEDEAGSPDIHYKFSTDATAVGTVRVKIDDDWKVKTPASTDAANGELVMTRADVIGSGNTSSYEVRADVTLRPETNHGDMLEDMNDRYQGRPFDASNYDLVEWAAEAAKLSDNGQLYMDKQRRFFDWVEEMQVGSDFFWLYTVQGDGKRSLRVDDPNRAIDRVIEAEQIKEYTRSVTRDFEQFASTVTTEYDKDHRTGRVQREENDDHQTEVIETYGFPQDETLPSLLTAQADAARKSAVVAEDWSEARPVAAVTINLETLDDLKLALYSMLSIDLSVPEDATLVRGDVFTIDSESADSFVIDSTATDALVITPDSVQVNVAGREYWGTLRAQLIEIGFDLDALDIDIVARQRPVSEVV